MFLLLQSHSDSESQIFVCGMEECGKIFKWEDLLERHMKRHQPKERKKNFTEPESEKEEEVCKI